MPEKFCGDPERFSQHEKFFIEEVIPYIEKEYKVSHQAADRAIGGYSNGA